MIFINPGLHTRLQALRNGIANGTRKYGWNKLQSSSTHAERGWYINEGAMAWVKPSTRYGTTNSINAFKHREPENEHRRVLALTHRAEHW